MLLLCEEARAQSVLLLNRREVERLLDLDRLIEALGPAMADLSAGRVSMPPRNRDWCPKGEGCWRRCPSI